MRPVVVITETLDAAAATWLSQHAEVVWSKVEDGASHEEHLARADALIVRTFTQVDRALLERAPRLRVVGRAGVGLENIDITACRYSGVEVVYTPDANTQAVVEYVVSLMLDALRPRHTIESSVTDRAFHDVRKKHVGTQLDTLTLGILGFGRVGQRLGRVAHSIGMRLLVNDLLPERLLRDNVDYDFSYVDKETLWRESDVLSIHIDGQPSNRHLIDQNVLGQLKPTCLLINTSRGMVIDSLALAVWSCSVLDSGGRAVLDVHDPEPPPQDYPIYSLPNVRLLPHLASRTHTALANMSDVVRDVVAVLNGDRPKWPAPNE